MDDANLRASVRHGLIWRSGTQFVAQAAQWCITMLVIRLLTPADYGLVAMAEVVTGLFLILSGAGGFATALIQAPALSERQTRQFFGLLITVNVALAAVQVLGAEVAARYFRQELIADILRVQAINYLLLPFIAMPVALASRRMEFKRPALVQFWATLISGFSVLVLAFAGWGVWALVAGTVILHVARATGMALATRWLMWPEFRFDGLGRLLTFGSAMVANSVIWFAYAQSDIVIAGRALTATEVGLYTTALFLATLPVSKFLPVLNEVGFTAYARIQDDRRAVALNFLKAVRLVALVCFPVFLGLHAVAPQFVALALGEKWLAAVPLLQLLTLAMPLYAVAHLISPAVTALGHARVQTINMLLGLLIMPAAFLIGVRYGSEGLAVAWLTAYPLLFAITAARSLPLIGASFRDLRRACWPPVAASGAMAASVMALAQLTGSLQPVAELGLLIGAGVVVYAAVVSLLFPAARAEIVDLVRR